jgi:hypothetical protein
MSEPTREQTPVPPESTTRSPWHVSRIPGHLGPARTSTVVLGILFLAIFALYLYIKPDTTAAVTSGTGNQVPASPIAPAPQTTAPTTTTTTPEPTQEQPTPTGEPTTTGSPTDLPTPSGTPSTSARTSGLPTSLPPPTTAATSPSG